MQDDFIYSFGLGICLGMSHRCELNLTLQGAEAMSDLCGVELSTIVEDHYSRNAEADDHIFLDKLLDLDRGDGSDGLSSTNFTK